MDDDKDKLEKKEELRKKIEDFIVNFLNEDDFENLKNAMKDETGKNRVITIILDRYIQPNDSDLMKICSEVELSFYNYN